MNLLYTKSVLYAYPVIDALIGQIDDLVLGRALSSMYDVSPADEQCEKIIAYTEQKKLLLKIHLVCEEVLSSLDEVEIDHLDYKFFKKKPKEHFKDFDSSSRAYFRRQQVLCEKISRKLENVGINDDWFIKNCLPINFFRELLKRVKEKEVLDNKNKTSRPKKTCLTGYVEKLKSLSGLEPERHSENKVLA